MAARPYLFVNGGKTMKLSMGKVMKTAMIAGGLAALPTVANAATAMLAATDYVGISFWTISMAMMAAAIFFLMED